MPKRPAAYHRPDNLDEALRYLSQPDTAPLAGGTALLAREEGVPLAAVVDLQDLGLDQISLEDECLSIGATISLANLDQHLAAQLGMASATPLLRQAIAAAGPNTYRNAATLGGICASRLPDSELLATLLVLEAELIIRTPAVARRALGRYLHDDAQAKGLITEIIIPWVTGHGASVRVARTPKDYPIVSITAWKPAAGSIRLAATGIGEKPQRLTSAESALQAGQDEDAIAEAAIAASAATMHPGDFRGDTRYRADMAAVLTRRVLQEL